jgi:hypothetical protein
VTPVIHLWRCQDAEEVARVTARLVAARDGAGHRPDDEAARRSE